MTQHTIVAHDESHETIACSKCAKRLCAHYLLADGDLGEVCETTGFVTGLDHVCEEKR